MEEPLEMDDLEEPLGTPVPVSRSVSRPRPREAPQDQLEAAFELGATQEAVLKLRREIRRLQEVVNSSNGRVDDLESTLATTKAELSAVLDEERAARLAEKQQHRASAWERLLGG